MNELKYFVLFELKLVNGTFFVALIFLFLLLYIHLWYILLFYIYYYFSKFLRGFVFIIGRRFSLSFCGRLEYLGFTLLILKLLQQIYIQLSNKPSRFGTRMKNMVRDLRFFHAKRAMFWYFFFKSAKDIVEI